MLEPVQWESSDAKTLGPLVDLFLDLWVAPDGNYMVLDEDEFAEAATLGHLTREQVGHARSVLQELTAATARGEFPPAAVRDFRL